MHVTECGHVHVTVHDQRTNVGVHLACEGLMFTTMYGVLG